MLPIAILSLLTAAIAATHLIPTADEMQARFDHAQNFYASGAYDQAIENYRHIIRSRHKLLKMKDIRVSVGQIAAPLQEVAAYQTGNAYFKMAEEELKKAARSRVQNARFPPHYSRGPKINRALPRQPPRVPGSLRHRLVALRAIRIRPKHNGVSKPG